LSSWELSLAEFAVSLVDVSDDISLPAACVGVSGSLTVKVPLPHEGVTSWSNVWNIEGVGSECLVHVLTEFRSVLVSWLGICCDLSLALEVTERRYAKVSNQICLELRESRVTTGVLTAHIHKAAVVWYVLISTGLSYVVLDWMSDDDLLTWVVDSHWVRRCVHRVIIPW